MWLQIVLVFVAFLAVGCAIVFVSDPETLISASVIVVLGGAVYACAALWGGVSRVFLSQLMTFAYLLRAVFGLFLYYTKIGPSLFPDQGIYWTDGRLWSAYWGGAALSPPVEPIGNTHYYSLWVGVQNFLTMSARPVPLAMNAFCGALLILMTYRLVHEHLGRVDIARIAALIIAFLPSMVTWLSLNLRDEINLLFISWTLLEVLRMVRNGSWRRWPLLIPGLLGIYAFRSYMIVMMLMTIMLSMVASATRHPLIRAGLAIAALGVLGVLFFTEGTGFIVNQILESQAEQINYIHGGMAGGNMAYMSDAHVRTAADLARYVPSAIFYFVGGPFLWMITGIGRFALIPEFASWYLLLFFSLRGFLRLRARRIAILPLVTFFVLTCIFYSVVSGNFGTSVRHRAQGAYALVPLAAAGWPRRDPWRRRPSTTPAGEAAHA